MANMATDEHQSLPPVDVVLLSWNRVEMTIETIENLVNQQGINLKVWIVDQGSEPANLQQLKDAAQQYENVYIHELEENVGVPGGRNIGIDLGTAEYTVSIDNDAIFESPHALAQVVQIFEQEPDLGVIGFRIRNFYTSQDDEFSWVYPKSRKSEREQRFTTTRFSGCGHAIRRSVFEKAGKYDADLFFYWEETDLSYRIINLGYRLIYEPAIVVLHKYSPEARVRWEDKRFYYLVRNAIYMFLKYAPSKLKVITPALGYLIKGSYNNLFWQTLKGVIDGLLMYGRLQSRFSPSESLCQISSDARHYLYENELKYRGSFWNRVKTEVLVTLPGYTPANSLNKSNA